MLFDPQPSKMNSIKKLSKYVAVFILFWIAFPFVPTQNLLEARTNQIPAPPSISVEVPMVLAHVSLMRRDRPLEQVLRTDLQLLVDQQPYPITAFGREEWPLSLLLAVDVSGSVTQILPLLQKAAKETLSALRLQDRLALLAFSHQSRLTVPFTPDREPILEELGRLEASGGTALNDALYHAASALSAESAGRRRVILFLSDNRAMPANQYREEEALSKAQEEGTIILGIHLQTERDDPLKRILGSLPDSPRVREAMRHAGDLYRFARETGGEVVRLKRNEEIGTAFRRMTQRISSQYYLAIQPAALTPTQTLHTITVKLSPEGAKRWGSIEISHRRFFRY